MTDRPRPAPATAPAPARPSELAIWAGLLVLYVAWGSTYLAIRYALESFPPYLLVAFRFLLAGAILLAWNAATGTLRSSLPSRREWRDSAIVGGLLVAGGMGLVSFAEQTIPSGIAALLAALIPAWTALMGRLLYGEPVERLVGAGIVVGFGGVTLLVTPSILATGGSHLEPAGAVLMLISPILWATGSVYAAHRARLPEVATLASATQMLTGAAISFVVAFLVGEAGRFDPGRITETALVALLYLATVGGVLAFATYVWLVKVAPLPKVTTYAYVNPVLAFILGAVIAAEPLTPVTVVAGAVIVGGVALIVTGRGREAATAAERDALLEETAMAEAEGAGGARPGGLSSRR